MDEYGTDDTGSTDTGSLDTSSLDTGSLDTGSTDFGTGSEGAGGYETGGYETGGYDTGSTDTGSTDTGSADTGSTDVGSTDVGTGGEVADGYETGGEAGSDLSGSYDTDQGTYTVQDHPGDGYSDVYGPGYQDSSTYGSYQDENQQAWDTWRAASEANAAGDGEAANQLTQESQQEFGQADQTYSAWNGTGDNAPTQVEDPPAAVGEADGSVAADTGRGYDEVGAGVSGADAGGAGTSEPDSADTGS